LAGHRAAILFNYNFYTDQKWGKAANYTLCLNSSQLGYDKCESVIIECV